MLQREILKMADVKWIKITTDIFDDEKMYAIETQQDGQLMELIWFKLLCLAGKCNNHGFLMLNSKIAYTDEMLSKIFRVEIGSVQRALLLFEQLEMIELVDNAYMIANWDKHQNTQGLEDMKEKNRARQQRFRDRQKQALIGTNEDSNVTCNVTNNVKNNVNCSYSYSNSYSNSISNNSNSNNNIDSNKNTKEPKHKYGEYQHVLLTDTDRERLVNDYGEDETHEAIKYLDEYIETSGKKYKNHYLVMRKWVFDAVKEHKKKPSTGNSLDDWANA